MAVNPFAVPASWHEQNGTSPPSQWTTDHWAWLDGSTGDKLTYAGTFPTLPFTFTLLITASDFNPPDGIKVIVDGVTTLYQPALNTPLVVSVPAASTSLVIETNDVSGSGHFYSYDTLTMTPIIVKTFACEGPILEVWPPPNDTYTLRLRGFPVVKDFGVPDPNTGLYNDAGVTACDSRLVLLMALATAKAHYGRQDASVTANELASLLGILRAGEHGNKRYIPGAEDLDPRKMYVEPIWIK